MARPLEQAEFESLRDLISGKVGLYFPDEHAYLVARRLLPRLQALGLAGYSDYQDYLCNAALPERERQDEWQAAF
jgi:chemotaxis methyl-accepting protein methylase